MVTEQKLPEELNGQLPETKVEVLENGTMSGPLVGSVVRGRRNGVSNLKADVTQVILRLLCILTSVVALALMVTAKEASTVSVYGFQFPVYSKWSFSDSFE